MKLNHYAAVACVLVLCGCASVAPVQTRTALPDQHVVEKSYSVGEQYSAFVGEPIVRAKDYWVRATESTGMRASNDFTIRFPPFGARQQIRADEDIEVTGTTMRNGVTYTVVKIPRAEAQAIGLLVNPDGTFEGSGISLLMGGSRMGYNYTPEPATTVLRTSTQQSAVRSAGYTNFELIYSGASKDSIRMLYREYTANDMARPAFTQELTYDRGEPTIRFRKVLLQVLAADNEKIEYVVKEDGLDQ